MAAEHLLLWFWEIQTGSSNQLSEGLTWVDLGIWSRLMKIKLKPWQATALIRMGLAYQKAKSESKTPAEETEDDGSGT